MKKKNCYSSNNKNLNKIENSMKNSIVNVIQHILISEQGKHFKGKRKRKNDNWKEVEEKKNQNGSHKTNVLEVENTKQVIRGPNELNIQIQVGKIKKLRL